MTEPSIAHLRTLHDAIEGQVGNDVPTQIKKFMHIGAWVIGALSLSQNHMGNPLTDSLSAYMLLQQRYPGCGVQYLDPDPKVKGSLRVVVRFPDGQWAAQQCDFAGAGICKIMLHLAIKELEEIHDAIKG